MIGVDLHIEDAERRGVFERYAVGESGCWIWTGATMLDGYGYCYGVKRAKIKSHRLFYMREHGAIPSSVILRHTCDVRLCVNPAHLITGTRADNVRDAVERNRTAFGSRHHRAMLDEAGAVEAHRRLCAGESAASIADSLGVARQTINAIKSGRTWRRAIRGAA